MPPFAENRLAPRQLFACAEREELFLEPPRGQHHPALPRAFFAQDFPHKFRFLCAQRVYRPLQQQLIQHTAAQLHAHCADGVLPPVTDIR